MGRQLNAFSQTGDALRNAQQSQSAQSSQLETRAADGPTKEDESSDESSDDDDNEDENDGQEKPPVFHHEIWRRLLRRARRSGLRYGLLPWSP